METFDVLLRRRRLRWFLRVMRKGQEEPLGRTLKLKVTGKRPWGCPKKIWKKVVETDMRLVEPSEIGAQDRAK